MKRRKRDDDLKPTTGLVKQALFNILGDIKDLDFLDLFAGTGQIGLEAEKRGANVVFIEINKRRALKIKEKTKRGKVIIGDALVNLFRLGEFDIIFADPPYNYTKYAQLLKLAQDHLTEGGLLIVEHFKKTSLENIKPPHLLYEDKRKYGDTVLSFFRKI
jgi:16S rRNA (guanine(966)-N(2))-methyltransferase RsmD